ncbi:MAG: hypothetical protein IJ396_07735 [Oscillibacter sp.]|nr:hypothetical protein [Oscillibacter sp.]MBQ7778787.1 hypothetical protein [Oscillibacter sp.]
MATRVISTSIKLDGEAEFKKQLTAVNGQLKNLNSEMKLASAEFRGQANTLDALTKKDELLRKEKAQLEEKIRSLEKAVADCTEVYGEASTKTDGYRQSMNRAKVDLLKLNDEIDRNDRYLSEAKSSADKTAKSIDRFGKEAKDAGGDLEGAGDGMKDFLEGMGNLKKLVVGGAVVAGLKEMGDAVLEVVDSTAEYRTIMASLATSSEAAGYSADQTAELYAKLQGVLGDTQTAATATANLQALGYNQELLMMVTDAAIGAWTTYGDSIPIDGLAEAINETVKAGQVTGTFADVLNWAGVSEDAFNDKLAACKDESARTNQVMLLLSSQGLVETGRAWQENNQDLIALNESQEKWNEAMAGLGEALTPAANAIRTIGAAAIEDFTEIVKAAVDWVGKLVDKFNDWRRNGAKEQVNEIIAQENAAMGINGSHAGGLDYVPFDNYVALLHKGERVQTAAEAALSRELPRQQTAQNAMSEAALGAMATQAAAQAAGAMANRPIEINVTTTLDGRTVARNQYRHNQDETQRRGASLVQK